MRIFCAAVTIVFLVPFLAVPAYAQTPDGHIPRYGEKDPDKTPQQKEADKAAERAYQRSLGNITDKGAVDPWGTARSLNEPKSDTKAAPKAATKAAAKSAPVKPQTRTGDTD